MMQLQHNLVDYRRCRKSCQASSLVTLPFSTRAASLSQPRLFSWHTCGDVRLSQLSTKPLLWGRAEGSSCQLLEANRCSLKDRKLLCLQNRQMGRSVWQTSAKEGTHRQECGLNCLLSLDRQ